MTLEQQINKIIQDGIPVNVKVEQNTLIAAYGIVILAILLIYLLLQLISRA